MGADPDEVSSKQFGDLLDGRRSISGGSHVEVFAWTVAELAERT
jgi:hypothetical protein